MYKTVLVPLDGSEVAVSILEQVVALARGYGARLLLLTVGFPCQIPLAQARELQLSLTFQAEAYLHRVSGELRARGLEISTTVCIGDPATEILDVAEREQVDLIIIASRGEGGTPAPFLGSVAEKVAGAAPIPVLVVRAAAEGEG